MSSSAHLLILAADGKKYYDSHGSDWVSKAENAVGADSHCFCDDLNCIKAVSSDTSVVLHFDDFPVSYESVVNRTSSQWFPPKVLGISESEDGKMLRVRGGEYYTDWRPKEELDRLLHMGIKNYTGKLIDESHPAFALAVAGAVLLITLIFCG